MNTENAKNVIKSGFEKISSVLTQRRLIIAAVSFAAIAAVASGVEYMIDHKAPAGALDRAALEAGALEKVPGAVDDVRYKNRAGIDLALVDVETLDGHARVLMNAQTGEILRVNEAGHGKDGHGKAGHGKGEHERGNGEDQNGHGQEGERHGDNDHDEFASDPMVSSQETVVAPVEAAPIVTPKVEAPTTTPEQTAPQVEAPVTPAATAPKAEGTL